jgi:hypothetical protein
LADDKEPFRVPDLLSRIHGEIRERLIASRDAVEEYDRLERALRALSVGPREETRTEGTGASSRRGPAGEVSRRGASSVQRRADRERLLAVIAERPGITRQGLRDATGLSAPGVAQHVRRMIEAGQLLEQASGGGEPGYAIVAADADASGEQPAQRQAPVPEAGETAASDEAERGAADTAGTTAPDAAEPDGKADASRAANRGAKGGRAPKRATESAPADATTSSAEKPDDAVPATPEGSPAS